MEQQSLPVLIQRHSAQSISSPSSTMVHHEIEPRRVSRVVNHVQYDSHAQSRLHEVFLIAVIACSILTLISLFQLNPTDNHGWAFFLNRCFGALRYLMPFYLLYFGSSFYAHWKNEFQSMQLLVLKLLGASTF